MYKFSIMPMRKDFITETVEDIREQYESGVTTCPLFTFYLVPEGNPVWDKVSAQVELYAKYKKELDFYGIKSGVLLQSTIGHRSVAVPSTFQKYVGLANGIEENIYCPEDEDFLNHIANAITKIAKVGPSAIMLDDDFRLVARPGAKGCCCPLHLKEFNRLTNGNFTREEVLNLVETNKNYEKIFMEMEQNSLIKAATLWREAIDKVDPTIQGINCTSGDYCESVVYTNKIFAGKNNPTMVRMANGNYAPLSSRGFSSYAVRLPSVRISKLKNNGINIVLAETDTCPFNRYAKSARYLHAHFTSSVLLGAKGAKHWLTRTSVYEPNSGKEYRKILAKHNGLYEELSKISDKINWVGAGITFEEQDFPSFNKRLGNEWSTCVLERMGIPFYFTSKNKGIAFMEYDIVKDLTDEKIENYFENGSVVVDCEASEDLCLRGFSEKLGVNITKFNKGEDRSTTEIIDAKYGSIQKQQQTKKVEIIDNNVEILSKNVRKDGNNFVDFSPAVTCFDKGDGKLSVVYAGTPNAPFNYTQGFSFLNESRKKQIVSILKRANCLPVYYEGDNEIMLTAGKIDDILLVFTVLLGFDPMDSLDLYLEKEPTEIKYYTPNGSLEKANFTKTKENSYSVDVKVEPMYPVILLIK